MILLMYAFAMMIRCVFLNRTAYLAKPSLMMVSMTSFHSGLILDLARKW